MSIDPASSSVAELRQAMADGRLTATALTQRFLERIAELNPSLHAVITVNHDALAEAARAWPFEEARKLGGPYVFRMNLNQQSSGPTWEPHKRLIC